VDDLKRMRQLAKTFGFAAVYAESRAMATIAKPPRGTARQRRLTRTRRIQKARAWWAALSRAAKGADSISAYRSLPLVIPTPTIFGAPLRPILSYREQARSVDFAQFYGAFANLPFSLHLYTTVE